MRILNNLGYRNIGAFLVDATPDRSWAQFRCRLFDTLDKYPTIDFLRLRLRTNAMVAG